MGTVIITGPNYVFSVLTFSKMLGFDTLPEPVSVCLVEFSVLIVLTVFVPLWYTTVFGLCIPEIR